MLCEETQERLAQRRVSGASDAVLDAHLKQCARCEQRAASEAALDRLLLLDSPHTPGPGFDTRFFARLDAERGKQRRGRVWGMHWAGWALVPIAAGVALVLMRAQPQKPATQDELLAAELEPDDVDLVLELELVEDLPVIQQLDELEAFELLEAVDQAELDKLAAETK